jgi:NitT/TauT family transport system substrate-binding protein
MPVQIGRNIALGLALGVASLLLGGCRAHSSAPAAQSTSAAVSQTAVPKQIKWATTGFTWPGLPDIVAQGKGFYAAQNLTVEQVVAGQSAAVCQQILARAVDIGSCNLNDMVQAVEASDAPLIQYFTIDAEPLNQTVVAKPSVKSWADLKGKTVIVGGPKDNTAYFFRIMARGNGLKDNDYDFQYAGASAARYAALRSGAVDAAIIVDPYDSQAVQAGYTKLDELVPKYANSKNYGYMTAAVNKNWAKDHPDELSRFIRADLNAVNWIYDPANKQELFSLVGPKLNIDQATFDRLYQHDVVDVPFWSRTGEITDAGVQGVLNSLVELGNLKQPTPPPSKYYDLTYLKLAVAGMKH